MYHLLGKMVINSTQLSSVAFSEVFGAAEAAPASTAEKESSAHSAMRSQAILGVQDGCSNKTNNYTHHICSKLQKNKT